MGTESFGVDGELPTGEAQASGGQSGHSGKPLSYIKDQMKQFVNPERQHEGQQGQASLGSLKNMKGADSKGDSGKI